MGKNESFEEQGFLILENESVGQIVREIQSQLLPLATRIVQKDPTLGPRSNEIKGFDFKALFDWTLANEKNQTASRAFYELFPASPCLVKLVANETLHQYCKQVGIQFPIPSTLPILRIDRPGDEIHSTPNHQDYWFSLLSPNSITFWFPILPVTPDMGLLQVVPGSHKEGLIKFKASGKQNPFVSAKEFSDSSFIDVSVGDNQILVFSQMLMHRSGVNHSEKTRLTLQARFNDLECMEEMTTSFTPAHSKFTIRAQSKILEETKDL